MLQSLTVKYLFLTAYHFTYFHRNSYLKIVMKMSFILIPYYKSFLNSK